MNPIDVAYDICRHYVKDLKDVDPALVAKIDGFRRSRNLAGLTSCSCHFDRLKHTVRDWQALRQVEAFFKKNACLANDETCREAAKTSFEEAEEQCSRTNRRLKRYCDNYRLMDDKYRGYVFKMARYIQNVLGNYQTFTSELSNLVKVTPGATAHTPRRASLPQNKMRMRLYATSRCANILKALYHYHGFRLPRIKATTTNRVELVPKNWKTDRTIACEPEGNLPLQLAFDKYAKRRMRRFGIDLRDQSANMKLARHASIHDDYVTVDFSKASDTISYNAVLLVFPEEWFSFLAKVRTPAYRGVFGEGVYAKFSSMGNGSTFAIETLMFAAACRAVGSRDFLVYGDDVIIEKEFYSEFLELTRFLGFTINEDKSFAEGPFRESCGGDYFDGIDVTPVYIRSVDKRKASLCHLVNTMASIAEPGGSLVGYLLQIVADFKLPLVPYSLNTMAGIHIFPAKARALGLLRNTCTRTILQPLFESNGSSRPATKLAGRKHRLTFSCVDTYKAYFPKYRRKYFVDSRGYYLWFLNVNSQVLFSGPWAMSRGQLSTPIESSETSSVLVFDHKYVRKRVHWREPVDGYPDHLYWWSDQVTAR